MADILRFKNGTEIHFTPGPDDYDGQTFSRMLVDVNDDYITINPAVAHDRFNVCVMKFDHTKDDYYVFRISEALPRHPALCLARSWAAATRLEIR